MQIHYIDLKITNDGGQVLKDAHQHVVFGSLEAYANELARLYGETATIEIKEIQQ